MDKKYLYVVMWNDVVEKKEISRETEKSFWDVFGYRMNKHSEYCNAFNTLEEANLFIIGKKRVAIENIKNRISFWKKRLPELEKELEDFKEKTREVR